jgi:hypothetical protein
MVWFKVSQKAGEGVELASALRSNATLTSVGFPAASDTKVEARTTSRVVTPNSLNRREHKGSLVNLLGSGSG